MGQTTFLNYGEPPHRGEIELEPMTNRLLGHCLLYFFITIRRLQEALKFGENFSNHNRNKTITYEKQTF